MAVSEKFVGEFDEEFPITRKFLELVPDDKLSWKPHEKSMELGRLAWHLANFPEWCRETLGKDIVRITAEDVAKQNAAWQGKKRADFLTKFDADLPEARKLIAMASDVHLASTWMMERDGRLIMDEPREHVLRRMVFNHMVHHRAQLGIYLRLNDIAVPGPYGPSADERMGSGVDHR